MSLALRREVAWRELPGLLDDLELGILADEVEREDWYILLLDLAAIWLFLE